MHSLGRSELSARLLSEPLASLAMRSSLLLHSTHALVVHLIRFILHDKLPADLGVDVNDAVLAAVYVYSEIGG